MATDGALFDELFRAFCGFHLILEAATLPTGDGGRRVGGRDEARVLSEHTERLRDRLFNANRRIATNGVCNDAAMIEALLRAESALASLGSRSAGSLADGSAESFQRFQHGDTLGSDELRGLQSAHELLAEYEQRTRTGWADASPAELDGTCEDLSGERRSICNAVKSTVSAAEPAVSEQLRAFASLSPADHDTNPTFDSSVARAVAVFRLLEVADAAGISFSHLLPPGLVFSKPTWVPGDDPADAPEFLAKCARWLQRMESVVSDHLAATAERVAARHTPQAVSGGIARPDFHLTSDIRATSDPLWRQLAAFRRRLMEGGTFTTAEWHALLIDIRNGAHAAGLRPSFGTVEWIVATLPEAREGDPSGSWNDEPDGWSKIILAACGDAGWIQLHDLLDGFNDNGRPCNRHKRVSAIEWAESWMNARERQLAEPAALSMPPDLVEGLQRAVERVAERIVLVPAAGVTGGEKPPANPSGLTNQSMSETRDRTAGETPPSKRLVKVSEAAEPASKRPDVLLKMLRCRKYPVVGPKGAYLAELEHVICTVPRKRKAIQRWADEKYPLG